MKEEGDKATTRDGHMSQQEKQEQQDKHLDKRLGPQEQQRDTQAGDLTTITAREILRHAT